MSEPGPDGLRRMPRWVGPALALVTVLVIWSVLAWAFIFAFSGGHACAIVRTVVEGSSQVDMTAPMTDTEMATATARCNRPDLGAIAVFGIGYVVIVVLAVFYTFLEWRRPPQRPR